MGRSVANVLFLGGAKRVSMGRRFMEAAEGLGADCRIFSYELTEREPIACVGEVVKGLRWKDPNLREDLLRLCRAHGIVAVVPFVDGAVAPAAGLADEVFVPTSDPMLATMAFDKVMAQGWFEGLGLPVPRCAEDGGPDFADGFIAKPRFGSASKGIRTLHSREELATLPADTEYLIQEYIADREEYTVDCYAHTGTGEIIATVPRRRLEVSGGEVTRTVTFADHEVEALACRTLQLTGLRGAVTVQMLRDRRTGRLMIMEINPRLGGGAVCSVAAGADMPQYILREALGLPLEPARWTPGVEIARYPQEVVFMP